MVSVVQFGFLKIQRTENKPHIVSQSQNSYHYSWDIRPIARIFRCGVMWMSDVYICMHKQQALLFFWYILGTDDFPHRRMETDSGFDPEPSELSICRNRYCISLYPSTYSWAEFFLQQSLQCSRWLASSIPQRAGPQESNPTGWQLGSVGRI